MEPGRIFLLGGHDLEMETIAELLAERRETFLDAGLAWDNACLSRYESALRRYGGRTDLPVYGIELQEDIPPPANYRRIDHHNELQRLPSSLEQVAALLGIVPDRYRRLVAANDKAYIPGMLALGAGREEIERIRAADRRAQGVTAEDERLAEKAIRENQEQAGDLRIVRAFTSRFSPICDRLYPFGKLLVYTDREMMYYGKGVREVCALLERTIGRHRFFRGGSESAGYAGIPSGSIPYETITTLIDRIKQL